MREFGFRLGIFRFFVFGALFCLGLALFDIQVRCGGEYRDLANRNRIRLLRLEAPRGDIYDRNGAVLATSRPSFDVFVIPEDFDKKNAGFLSEVLGLAKEKILAKVTRLKDAPFVPVLLKRDVKKNIVFKLEERKPELEGVSVEIRPIRFYPQGTCAAHVLGYLGKISKREYENQPEEDLYRFDDWIGRSGVEKIFERVLKGEDGGKQIEVNSRGRMIRILGEKDPEAGSDIFLTIDSKLQEKVARIFGERTGSAVILDLETGDILALVSKPDFDPNVFVSPREASERAKVFKNPSSPLLNRGISTGYPPGPVFKLVTAISALETGTVPPAKRFYCKGSFRLSPRSRAFQCWRAEGHGAVNLFEAIEQSCNVYFYNLGSRAGPDSLSRYAHELGLGEPVEIELPNVSPGVIPSREWKKKIYHDSWYEGETLNFAIGQGYVLTTPLQILRLVGFLATEGNLPEIHIEKTGKKSGKMKKPAIRPGNIRLLIKAMNRVIQTDRGTGQLARVDFMEMAGKTGTAQSPPKEPHSWFAGFFPYQNPKYALVVLIEHGGSGGFYAAKLSKEIILGMKELGTFDPVPGTGGANV